MKYEKADIFGYINCDGEHTPLALRGVDVTFSKERDIDNHRKVFGCLGHTVKYMKPREGIETAKDLLLVFKDLNGMYDVIPTKNGNIRKYHSIAFDNMDETEFRPIAEKIKDFCCIILGDSPIEVTDKLIKIIIGRRNKHEWKRL